MATDFTGSQFGADEVLAGIKRNQITGVPPKNMDVFTVKLNGSGSLRITVQVADTVVDGQLLCTVGGVKVVRKEGSAPASLTDGTLVIDHAGGDSFTYDDTGLTNGTTYYYRAFPYSDHGVYNWNEENIRSAVPSAIKTWAFVQNFADTNPDTTISYPEGYENSDFAKMHTNSGTGTVTAGDWGDFLVDTLKNLPYMVGEDGVADYQLDPNDYTKKLDGTASDYNNLNYNGGAFAWLNKIYMKETYTGDTRLVEFADGALEGFTAVGFTDGENELEGLSSGIQHLRRVGADLCIVVVQRIYACSYQTEASALVDLDHADTACADLVDLLHVAECRNIHANLVCSFKYGGTLRNRNCNTIDLYVNISHVQFPP
jgi:hypothetical protein